MCEICNSYPCSCHCPNYTLSRSLYYCSVCGDAIQNGEEYIRNDNDEYAHWDCVWYGRELVAFLGYEVKTMEEIDD